MKVRRKMFSWVGKELFIITTAIVTLALGPGQGFSAEPCISCEDLLTIGFGPEVTITSAEVLTEISGIGPFGPYSIPVPEHCDVRGTIWPEQGFNVKLPTGTGWNDRVYVVGNGVAAGSISEDSMAPGLEQGFATAGTDTGHQGFILDWSFGYNPPDNSNPNAPEKLIDYCDESIHETTVLAKQIVAAYYCAEPAFSYYVGCSTGGRQGLIEAQRYPQDFDGLLVGAPVHHLAEITMRGLWEGQQLLGAGDIDPAKLPLLAEAVMGKCDGIDGLVDGLIDDPRSCTFDARIDLPACADDVDGPDCFTTAQRNAIYTTYDGPRNSAGDLLTFGEAFGSETMVGPTSGWIPWIAPAPSLALLIGIGFNQYIGLDPPPGPVWDFTTFDFDTDWTNVMDNIAALCNATDPDLSTFKELGGKIIHYDGWADQATGPYQTVDYYESVLDVMGARTTHKFYKLYMIPGMFHCGGGLGCFDGAALFDALVDWVENEVEPTTYPGSGVNPLGEPRTRPMCPYPEVARYVGEGSIEDAGNFMCVPPIEVRIKPEVLNLKRKGKFTAFITVPRDYRVKDWNLQEITCEGAPAIFGRAHKNVYIAKFRTQDMQDVAPGKSVTLTVKGEFYKDGETALVQASDTVRVIGPKKPPKKCKKKKK